MTAGYGDLIRRYPAGLGTVRVGAILDEQLDPVEIARRNCLAQLIGENVGRATRHGAMRPVLKEPRKPRPARPLPDEPLIRSGGSSPVRADQAALGGAASQAAVRSR